MGETELKFMICQTLVRETGGMLMSTQDMNLSHGAIGRLRTMIADAQRALLVVDSSLVDVAAEFPEE